MKQRFEIPGRLAGLNEYTKANRSSYILGNKMKQKNQEAVMWAIKAAGLRRITRPVYIHITWIEPNIRRDIDNIRFAAKFILDALVKLDILTDDSQRHVLGISDRFMVNKENPRIIVEIEEA